MRYLREAVDLEPDHEPAVNLLRRLLAAGADEPAPSEPLAMAEPWSPPGPAHGDFADADEFGGDLEVEVESPGAVAPDADAGGEVEAFAEAGDAGLGEAIEIVDEPSAEPEAFFDFDEDDDYVQAPAAGGPPGGGAPLAGRPIDDEPTPVAGRAFDDSALGSGAAAVPPADEVTGEELIEEVDVEEVEEVDEVEPVEPERSDVLPAPPGVPRAGADETTRAFDRRRPCCRPRPPTTNSSSP